jgi:hypothetical protein
MVEIIMNKTLKSNPFTFIVQAEKIDFTYPDGEHLLKPIKAHYFRTLDEVDRFLSHYIKVIMNDPTILSLMVGSKYSVTTEMPIIAHWRRN